MAQTFAEMAAQRDPLYAATRARTVFLRAIVADEDMAECERDADLTGLAKWKRIERDAWLLKLTIRALRNQRQPYYDAR